MNKNQLCIATICWARNEGEENLLRQSLSRLAELQIPVFITDGGSNDTFLEFVRSMPNFTLLKAGEKGVYAQAKNSLQAAYQSGTPFIFYTEPDKELFFANHLAALLNNVSADDSLGVYLASRSPKGFASFPRFQQITETTINQCCAEVIGQDMDFTYGPFLLNRRLVASLRHITEDIGWGWRPFVFIMAHRMGLTVDCLADDFLCPEDQRQDDAKERIYRMRQLEQNIRGIVMAATASL
jgi:hypothetical protein